MDFEQSIISAIETELPLEMIDGCYFHYSQSLWKRLGKFGLIAPYKNDQDFKGIIRKIMALDFLPLQFVSGVFFRITHEWIGSASTSIIPRISTVS